MHKQFIFLVSFACCYVFHMRGMELAITKKIHKEKFSSFVLEDIPFFPLIRNKKNPAIGDIVIANGVKHQGLLCNIAVLPEELREVIILKMFDHNPIAARVFLRTPFFYAMTFYHENKQLLRERLFIKEMSLDRLYCWSAEQKKEVMELSQSRHPAHFFYQERVFTQERVAEIRLLDLSVRDDFFVGEEVLVIEPEESWRKYSYVIPCGCAGVGLASTAIVSTAGCLIGYCSKFIFVFGGITAVTSCMLGAVGAALLYADTIRKNIRREII